MIITRIEYLNFSTTCLQHNSEAKRYFYVSLFSSRSGLAFTTAETRDIGMTYFLPIQLLSLQYIIKFGPLQQPILLGPEKGINSL